LKREQGARQRILRVGGQEPKQEVEWCVLRRANEGGSVRGGLDKRTTLRVVKEKGTRLKPAGRKR